MNRNIVAEVSVVPLGTEKPGVSRYVAACIDIIDGRNDVRYQLTPMGTILEGSMDAVLNAVRLMHEVPFNRGAKRVVTTLKIDDRRDKKLSMKGKINSVMKSKSHAKET
ncbi:MAG TPA: hypothetical protein DCX22_00910 [Dehalococcoidia bacterium]|nr:hypothetical protein [Dehalococcoidia bacterium]